MPTIWTESSESLVYSNLNYSLPFMTNWRSVKWLFLCRNMLCFLINDANSAITNTNLAEIGCRYFLVGLGPRLFSEPYCLLQNNVWITLNVEAHLVIELCKRHFCFNDDDNESKERTRQRVVCHAFATFRQDIAKTKPVSNVMSRYQAGRYISVLIVVVVNAFCTSHRTTPVSCL